MRDEVDGKNWAAGHERMALSLFLSLLCAA